MLLYGISLLPNGCGTLKIVSDALKTDKDKNGDFSRSWAEAVRSTSSTKGDNRAWILVDVKNGVPEKTEILDAYKETLNWWLKGEEPEHCSVDTCNKCEFTELCHYNHRPVAKNQNEVKKMVLSDLSVSKEQQRIVDFNEGICVSNAGAGSGKSHSIAIRVDNKTDERTYIVKWIKQLIESGKAKPEEIAVISSKRSTLAGISRLLSESNILSQYDMGERILDDSRVKAALGFLEFMSDIDATKGLLEYLNEKNNNTIFSMDENTIMSLIDQTKAQITSVYEPLSSEEKKDFLLQHLKALDDGTDKIYSDFVTSIERKTLYSASDIVSYGLKMKLYDFNNTGEKEGEYEAISLVTAHSSKGKEWKYVFGSLSDFDNANIHYSQDEIEEKRRLIYVLMTRAKEHLILTCTEMLSTKKSEETSIYNRFFREIERGLKDDYDFIYHPTLLLKKTIA